MDLLQDIVNQIELHSVEGIKRCFSAGVSPNESYRGKPLIDELTSEYTRSPRFKECVQAFVDFGLVFENKALLSVLLDDDKTLETILVAQQEVPHLRYSLRCAYTSLMDVSLLHICAEFNHVKCARILVNNGAEVDAKAGIDNYGFGGQSPIFHTVNQNSNQSEEMMDFLIENAADLSITVKGVIWGKGYEWETLIPAVNPISYAMMGLLPQMHRNEVTISKTISTLLKHSFNIDYTPQNSPNRYLKGYK